MTMLQSIYKAVLEKNHNKPFQNKHLEYGREVDDRPSYAYLVTNLIQTNKILVRKLRVIGIRDWLLIFEDTLVELSVKDAYEELEVIVV